MQNNISISEVFKEAYHLLLNNKSYLSKVYLISGLVVLPFIVLMFVSLFIALAPILLMYKSSFGDLGDALPAGAPDINTLLISLCIFLIFLIITVIASAIVNLGVLSIQIGLVDGQKLPLKNIFKGYKYFWRASISGFIAGFFILLGFIALIIPGIYLAVRYSFVGLAAVDPKVEVGAFSITEYVWGLTKGKFGLIAKFISFSFLFTVITSLLARLPILILVFLLPKDQYIFIAVLEIVGDGIDFIISMIVGLITVFASIIFYKKVQMIGNNINTEQKPEIQNVTEAPQTVQNLIASQEQINHPKE